MSLHPEGRPNVKRSRSDLSRGGTPVPEAEVEELKNNVPPFLRQSATEIKRKFEYIQDREEDRHASFINDPEPDSSHPWAQEASPESLRRNRYTDIMPWAQNRVHLKVTAGLSDYINASAISLPRADGRHELQYIAAQGPKQTSVDHFWQMVWHECGEVAVVVMLTKLNEGAREKCFQYFPSGDDSMSRTPAGGQTTLSPGAATGGPPSPVSPSSPLRGSFSNELSTSTQPSLKLKLTGDDGQEVPGSVTLIDTKWDDSAQAMIRKLSLVRGNDSRIIYHLLFSGWPDYGIPEGRDRAALLKLIRLSNEKNDDEQEKSPKVIHCSAGVGRTGTFISIEHLIRELDNGSFDDPTALQKQPSEHRPQPDEEDMKTWPDPVFETVSRLREQRPVMVQGLPQFAFIYEILADEWLKRKKRLLEDKRLTSEPSPKALRLGRGLKKMLNLIRDQSTNGAGSGNGTKSWDLREQGKSAQRENAAMGKSLRRDKRNVGETLRRGMSNMRQTVGDHQLHEVETPSRGENQEADRTPVEIQDRTREGNVRDEDPAETRRVDVERHVGTKSQFELLRVHLNWAILGALFSCVAMYIFLAL